MRILNVDDDAIATQASYAVLETPLEEATRIFNSGGYLDTLVRVDGQLRFRRRLCIFDAVVVPGSLIYPI